VLVYLRDAADPRPVIAEGVWRGEILFRPRGESGFGYDPIFYVPSCDCSVAELSMSEKAGLSHRGQAMAKLQQRLTAALLLAI
jgi:XTP/dITP diphosphohydrolase